MANFIKQFKGFRKAHPLVRYFTAIAIKWQALLWGPSVLAVGWGLHLIVGTGSPPQWVNWTAVMLALFVAGYLVWRPYHDRLEPKFEVKDHCRVFTPTTDDITGADNGFSTYFQLLPKCLTDGEAEGCRGYLCGIDIWDESRWRPSPLDETVPLEWSLGSAGPVTLHRGIEEHLNLLQIHSSDGASLCVNPRPLRIRKLFTSIDGKIDAFRFKVKVLGNGCRDVDLYVKVQLTIDPTNPSVELEQIP